MLIPDYSEALKFIHGRKRYRKAPSLARMTKLLSLLGNPQNELKMIHIAGTNGKGSVLTFLRNILQESDQKVGTFTSPFLEKFNERIAVNGVSIEDERVVELLNSVLPAVLKMDQEDENGPLEFEIVTAMMFVYFEKYPVDVVLVECGIGGRYDATNVIEPLLSVITTVGMDHMDLLGSTLAEIATQKAGIIKPKCPVICGCIPKEAQNVINAEAQNQASPLFVLGEEFSTKSRQSHELGEKFDFQWPKEESETYTIHMLGQHQIDNAAVAVATFKIYAQSQKLYYDQAMIRQGLNLAFWAGRLEKVNDEPLILIDGAHNEPAAQALSETLKAHFRGQDIYLLVAALKVKDVQKMIKIFEKIPNVHLCLTTFDYPGAMSLDEMESIKTRKEIHYFENWQTALTEIAPELSSDDIFVITGSLYFISQVRKVFKEEKDD